MGPADSTVETIVHGETNGTLFTLSPRVRTLREPVHTERFYALIECATEDELTCLLERMMREGRTCRAFIT